MDGTKYAPITFPKGSYVRAFQYDPPGNFPDWFREIIANCNGPLLAKFVDDPSDSAIPLIYLYHWTEIDKSKVQGLPNSPSISVPYEVVLPGSMIFQFITPGLTERGTTTTVESELYWMSISIFKKLFTQVDSNIMPGIFRNPTDVDVK